MTTSRETSRNVNILVLAIAVVMIGVVVAMFLVRAYTHQQHSNTLDDACWVAGGEYKGGLCVYEEKGSPEAKECFGLGGTVYMEDGRCFKEDGTLLFGLSK